MKKSTIKSVIGTFVFAYILAMVILVYVGGSLLVSGIKSYNKDCSVKYPIEKILDGNWFCPVGK